MIQTADRLGNVQEYYFSKKLRQIAELNAEGYGIMNLGIGSPDRMPDAKVIETLSKESAIAGNHGYQSYKGIPELRQAFAHWYDRWFGVQVDADTDILPLIGSKEGIFHIAMTYLNPGDGVLVPNPGYPTYEAASRLTGAEIVSYDLEEHLGWVPDLDKLASEKNLKNIKLMWTCFPNMPTGSRVDLGFWKDLVALAKAHDFVVCNDNPYVFVLNDRPMSLLEAGLNDQVIELTSLSKSYNMAGWRVGAAVSTPAHIQNILRFKSNLDSGTFLPTQKAASVALALGEEWFQELNKEYEQRKVLACQLLDLLSCSYDEDQVGMFVWAKVKEEVNSVEEWLDELMMGARIFISPGFIFGDNGLRYIRVSLCTQQSDFEEAIARVKKFLQP